MAFTTTYRIDNHTIYLGDVISTNLSLAVWLIDAFSERKPIGQPQVVIKEGKLKAMRNLSGYHIFNDLADGNYTVTVNSDLYFTEEQTFNPATLDPRNPVREIELTPKPSYPFQNNATLARGQVLSSTGLLSGADIRVIGKTIQTITDEKGEFVLYFNGIITEAITIEIKKGAEIKTVPATINEGETWSLGIINFP